MLKIPLSSKIAKKPQATPRRKFNVFLYPNWFALAIDMILFGPGVNVMLKV